MVDQYLPGVRWLEPEETAFGVRCLDCRPVTRSLTSMTGDMEIARRFSSARNSSGEEYLERFPENHIETMGDIYYPLREVLEEGALYKAAEMEDKWDIYHLQGQLFFTRSWTSELIFLAEVEVRDPDIHLLRVLFDPQACEGVPELAVQQVDFLMKSHVFNLEVPHPLTAELSQDDRNIVLYSYSMFGRRASFATYQDTLSIPTDWSRLIHL